MTNRRKMTWTKNDVSKYPYYEWFPDDLDAFYVVGEELQSSITLWIARYIQLLVPDPNKYISNDIKTHQLFELAYKGRSINSKEEAMDICERHYKLMILQ